MIVQRALLRLYEAGLMRGPMKRLYRQRTWRVQAGEASGLKLTFPQNLDFVRGSTEPPMQRCLAAHLGSGDVLYDVGANVGFFSMLGASRVGPDGAVYAFEPVEENVTAIRRNTGLNGFGNVTVFQVALDERSGTGSLAVTKWDGGSSLSTAAVAPGQPIEQRSVDVWSLDDLVQSRGIRPPTVVKIDVEGAELGALRGMVTTIQRFRPVLVYEIDDGDREAFARRWKELDQFVTGLGYRISHLQDSYANIGWFVGHSLAVPARRSPD